ncbi:MAG: helix-turn-helix domain-containing protein [Candidatus Micrarchaeota archaeon]
MWIADFKVWHEGSTSIELSKEYDAWLLNVNLNLFGENGKLYVARCASFYGNEAEQYRKAFMQKDKRVVIIGSDANQVFYYHEADEAFHTLLFDKSLFFVGGNVTRDGFQYWTVASLRKEPLLELFKRVEKLGAKTATIKLLSLHEGSVNVFSHAVLSELTSLQLRALQLAHKHGYFEYPRKISLEQLAKLTHIPRTTLQSHLRRAERTLVPALLGQIKK